MNSTYASVVDEPAFQSLLQSMDGMISSDQNVGLFLEDGVDVNDLFERTKERFLSFEETYAYQGMSNVMSALDLSINQVYENEYGKSRSGFDRFFPASVVSKDGKRNSASSSLGEYSRFLLNPNDVNVGEGFMEFSALRLVNKAIGHASYEISTARDRLLIEKIMSLDAESMASENGSGDTIFSESRMHKALVKKLQNIHETERGIGIGFDNDQNGSRSSRLVSYYSTRTLRAFIGWTIGTLKQIPTQFLSPIAGWAFSAINSDVGFIGASDFFSSYLSLDKKEKELIMKRYGASTFGRVEANPIFDSLLSSSWIQEIKSMSQVNGLKLKNLPRQQKIDLVIGRAASLVDAFFDTAEVVPKFTNARPDMIASFIILPFEMYSSLKRAGLISGPDEFNLESLKISEDKNPELFRKSVSGANGIVSEFLGGESIASLRPESLVRENLSLFKLFAMLYRGIRTQMDSDNTGHLIELLETNPGSSTIRKHASKMLASSAIQNAIYGASVYYVGHFIASLMASSLAGIEGLDQEEKDELRLLKDLKHKKLDSSTARRIMTDMLKSAVGAVTAGGTSNEIADFAINNAIDFSGFNNVINESFHGRAELLKGQIKKAAGREAVVLKEELKVLGFSLLMSSLTEDLSGEIDDGAYNLLRESYSKSTGKKVSGDSYLGDFIRNASNSKVLRPILPKDIKDAQDLIDKARGSVKKRRFAAVSKLSK
jgi:hypothetical protein